MSFISVLWLALLHALSGASPLAAVERFEAPAVVRAEGAGRHRASERLDIVMPVRAPGEALRPANVTASTPVARAGGAATSPRGAPAVALVASHTPALAARVARQALREYGAAGHGRAARGWVLPYFPTAPPLLG